ncbi:MAG: dihydrodipicolinate synthase family protein [Limisphaerales bacterium]
MSAPLKGIFPVIPTLFGDDNSLDLEGQRKVTRWALEAGAQGIVFPGVASEYNFLSPAERGELIALVADEVAGQVPIIGGASAPTSEEVIVAGWQALNSGINHLMVMAPRGFGQDLDAHQRFFHAIATALPEAKMILQNAPNPVGAGLAADAIASIAAAETSITYIKEETLPSGPAITALQDADIPHLQGVFGGGGSRYVIDEFDRGALAALPAVELTDLHVALYQAHSSGNHDHARELYRLSLPLLVSQAIYRMRLTKYVLRQRGIVDSLHVRAPLPELDEFTRRDIDRMLDDLRAVFP